MAIALTDLEKRTGQAIVNVFETGQALGNYGAVAVAADDRGGLSYGRSQAALMSGSLYRLIGGYCQAPGAQYADALMPYLPRMQQMDAALNDDAALKALLAEAGGDPAMRQTQDAFFDRSYWNPAVSAASGLGATTALGATVTYDSFIQSGPGGWNERRSDTNDAIGTMAEAGEQAWFLKYVELRRLWLASSSSAPVRSTVYRMDALNELILGNKWALELPLAVRGVTLDAEILSGKPAARRILRLASPLMSGSDVQAVQQALVGAGYAVTVDGVYGPVTADAVKAFQAANGLASDGLVGPSARAAFGLA